MIKNQAFLIRKGPEVPPGGPRCAPGSPEGELDCIYCSGLHTPPRDPGVHLVDSSPGPRPRGDYFILLFLSFFSLPPSFYHVPSC